MISELTEHARHWLGTSLSEIEFESTPIWFTAEELDTLSAKKRPDGKNESDILKLLETKTENKTKTDELVQLDYYQRKFKYQLRIEQQFVTKDVDGSPTQLDIDSSKQQELESVKELIESIKLRRATKKQTDTTGQGIARVLVRAMHGEKNLSF